MKNEVVAVVEIVDGVVCSSTVFIVKNTKNGKTNAVAKAEKLFSEIVKETAVLTDEEISDCLDNGYYQGDDCSNSVCITWPNVD